MNDTLPHLSDDALARGLAACAALLLSGCPDVTRSELLVSARLYLDCLEARGFVPATAAEPAPAVAPREAPPAPLPSLEDLVDAAIEAATMIHGKVRSSSVGGPGGSWLVLVAVGRERVIQVSRALAAEVPDAGASILRVSLARIAVLEAELQAQVDAAAKASW